MFQSRTVMSECFSVHSCDEIGITPQPFSEGGDHFLTRLHFRRENPEGKSAVAEENREVVHALDGVNRIAFRLPYATWEGGLIYDDPFVSKLVYGFCDVKRETHFWRKEALRLPGIAEELPVRRVVEFNLANDFGFGDLRQ